MVKSLPRREMPRPPRPRRWRRSGGPRWTPERIVVAMQAWAQEVGRPPRSYDWSPAIARKCGFPFAGAEKWEREHPRWPHHALVCARYGSWRAALRAAGFPGPAPLEIPRRERVQIARRLQSQLSASELADLLGVVPGTVRRYWHATTCPRCGGPKIYTTASSCPDCIPHVALSRPSRISVLGALRRWTRETGAPPRASDWSEPGGKWEREYPGWPSAGDVRAHFPTWSVALASAGLRPYRRAWTPEQVIAALQAWARAHGRAPQQREWQAANAKHPPASTVGNIFGSWSAALRAANLFPARRRWSVEEILDGLREFEHAHGRPPKMRELHDTRGTPHPPATAIVRTFGTFRAALAQLDRHRQ